MLHLLAPEQHSVLERLAQSRTLIALDYDGTLAPIAAHPEQAGMRPRTRDLLRLVALHYPCLILSGRSGEDLKQLMVNSGVALLVGNHGGGLEGSDAWRELVSAWRPALERALEDLPGVWVEDKGLSLTVHYRHSPVAAKVRPRVLSAAAKLTDARLVGAKMAVNVVPAQAPHKGTALAAQQAALNCNAVLFAGDDVTDEDAFAMNLPGEYISVRVGPSRRTKARYYLRNQPEIDILLDRLTALRLAAGNGSDDQERLSTENHLAGQQHI